MTTLTKDMTQGVIWKALISFSLPLILTNLLQQTYNTADLLLVSWLADDKAMAAIGATGSLIFMMLGLFNGFATGTAVLVASSFGAKDHEKMYRSVHSTYAIALTSGLVLTIIALIFTPGILTLMSTPADIFAEAVEYTRIYFLGSIPLLVYNLGTAILRSVGDSRTPLIYLIVSSVINIALDLLFIGPFNMRSRGAAVATVIAQVVTATMLTVKLSRAGTVYQLNLKDIRFHKKETEEIFRIGIPAGIQMSLISFSNVLIQSRTNSFGYEAVAGVSAANRYDAFMGVGVQSFTMASTTFTGQNYGAKKYDRLRHGARTATIMGAVYSLSIGILLIIYGQSLVAFFNDNPAVIDYGYRKMRVLAHFHFIFTIAQVLSGVIRGIGKSVVPMTISIFSMVGVRTFWNYVVPDLLVQVPAWADFARSIDLVFWSYPVSWVITFSLTMLYYFFGKGMPRKLKDQERPALNT